MTIEFVCHKKYYKKKCNTLMIHGWNIVDLCNSYIEAFFADYILADSNYKSTRVSSYYWMNSSGFIFHWIHQVKIFHSLNPFFTIHLLLFPNNNKKIHWFEYADGNSYHYIITVNQIMMLSCLLSHA